jgi:hypothetical protein
MCEVYMLQLTFDVGPTFTRVEMAPVPDVRGCHSRYLRNYHAFVQSVVLVPSI